MKRLAILASGSGTNAENIYRFFSNGTRIEVALVIYDRKDAGVARRMAQYGVKTLYLPGAVWKQDPESIIELLQAENIDLIVLAGFLRVIPPAMTKAFAGRILNIHPSLLPAYGGKGMFGHNVHKAVIDAGETRSGVTVHYVTDDIDGGEILMQESVEITPEDTAETLEQKIHTIEYSLYPRAIVKALNAQPTPPPTPVEAHIEKPIDESIEPSIDESINESINESIEKSPSEEWAEALGVAYDPEKIPPHIPGTEPPAAPKMVQGNGMPQGTPQGSGMQQRPRRPQRPGCPPNPDMPEMPNSYLAWAVVMTVLCCLPAGVVAIIFSSQVNSKYYAGDYEGARQASERAQIWIIVSFVLGVMANTLYVPLSLLFN